MNIQICSGPTCTNMVAFFGFIGRLLELKLDDSAGL